MAFGKDNSHLGNIPAYGGSFSQRAKTQARRPPNKGGGGGGGGVYWRDTYKPPEHTQDIIRLVAGNYDIQLSHDGETIVTEAQPYVPYREHHNGDRGVICSGGPLFASKKGALPCPGCVIFWEDVAIRKAKKASGDTTKGPNRVGCRDLYAFNVWDYGLYYKVPQVDKATGQFRMNQKGEPFYDWEKGHPNDPSKQGLEYKYGHLLAFPMGETYKTTILTWDTKVGHSCRSCSSLDSIVTVMKLCGNPQCRQPIYDPNNCTLTPEQRQQIDDYPYACQHCQQTNYVNEIIQCTRCQNPVRATIFDVDIQVQRMGTKGQQTFLQIFNNSEPRPIQIADPAILATVKPLDLLKKFAPTPPELQYKILGITPSAQTQQHPGPMAPPMQQMQPPPMQMGGAPPITPPRTPGAPPMQMQQLQPMAQPQQYQPPMQQQPQQYQQPAQGMQPQQYQPQMQPVQGQMGAMPVVQYQPPFGTPHQQ